MNKITRKQEMVHPSPTRPDLAGGYLPWMGGGVDLPCLPWVTPSPHPDLAGGTYLGWGGGATHLDRCTPFRV